MNENDSVPEYEYTTFPTRFLAYKWYKPLLVGLLTLVFMLIFQGILFAIAIVVVMGLTPSAMTDVSAFQAMTSSNSPVFFKGPGALVGIGGAACVLPALALAVLIVRDRPFSSYSSSRGGWNWKAFFASLGIAAAVYLAATAAEIAFFPDVGTTGTALFTVFGFIVLTVLCPFQCVAEEYIYRGLITQTLGSWFRAPAVAIVVVALTFMVSHGYGVFGMLAILVMSLNLGFLAWFTKGLEASSALHIANNLTTFYLAGFGLTSASGDVGPESLVLVIVINAVYLALIVLLQKKSKLFKSKGDGTIKFNEAYRARMAQKSTPAS